VQLAFLQASLAFFVHVAAGYHNATVISHDAVLIHFLRVLLFGFGGSTDKHHSECSEEYAFHSRWSRSGLD